jgi:hypothetical protein
MFKKSDFDSHCLYIVVIALFNHLYSCNTINTLVSARAVNFQSLMYASVK